MRVICSRCGKPLNVPDVAAGQAGQCPFCGSILQLPAAEEPVVTATLVEEKSTGSDGNDVYDFAGDWAPETDDSDPHRGQKPTGSSASRRREGEYARPPRSPR